MSEDGFTIRKFSSHITISRDQALDLGMVVATPEERAKREAWAVEYEQRKQAATEAMPVFVAQLAAITDPVARAVLDLHKDDQGYCGGCECYGYEAESPPWPCGTTEAVAVALGIPVPPDLDMVRTR